MRSPFWRPGTILSGTMSALIDIANLRFSYPGPGRHENHPVLDIAEFSVAAGESVFLHGPSGSGKTTLLGLLGGVLEPPADARVAILGQNLAALSHAERDAYRGAHLGYIFQMFNLIPYLSVRENILLPCRLNAKRREAVAASGASEAQTAARLAGALGIGEQIDAPVTQLSVGQQQRVAAARALIGRPELVIADEPTSALDADHRERFIELLFEQARATGATLLFVSHDAALQRLFDRSVSLPEINRVANDSNSESVA